MHAWMISHQLWGWIERVKNNSIEGLPGSAHGISISIMYITMQNKGLYIYICAWAPLQEFVRKAYWTVLCKTSCSACCAHRSTHVDLAERTALYAEVAPKGFWNALQQHDHCQPKMRWWDTVRHQPPNTDRRNSQISANIKGFSPVANFFLLDKLCSLTCQPKQPITRSRVQVHEVWRWCTGWFIEIQDVQSDSSILSCLQNPG